MAIKFKNKTAPKTISRIKKKMRVRQSITGTTERPRMTVFKSLKHLSVQLVDDTIGRTIVACSTLEEAVKGRANKEGAKTVGQTIAKRAKEKNISQVVFDRNGFRYHGKIKELADAAREAGLKF